MAKNDLAEQVQAILDARDQAERRKKDPETVAEMIDRISDATVEKLLDRLGLAGGGEEEEEEETAPVTDHPFFKPLGLGRGRSA